MNIRNGGRSAVDECVNDPRKWITKDLHDPHLVFKKNQAEPVRKKYGRIVNCESIVDQIINRMIFTEYGEKEGEAFPNCPNMKGIGFAPDQAEKALSKFEFYTDKGYKCYKSDVSKWEIGFSADCCDAFIAAFKATCENWSDENDIWLYWWKWSLIGNIKVNDDGVVFWLTDCQGMSSGNYETTSGNGAARVAAACDAGSVFCKTNGDDCLEWTTKTQDELMKAYADMNVTVRGVEENIKEYEFCSHIFKRLSDGSAVSYLSDPGRSIYDLLTKNRIEPGQLDNVVTELIHHPDKAMVYRFIMSASELFERKASSGNARLPA